MTHSLKLLLISAVVPDTTSGGRFAMYRHLVVKQDFEVAVAATTAYDAPVGKRFVIRGNRVIERLRRTRLIKLIYNLEYVINWIFLQPSLAQFARDFHPDVIFCVVEDWHMGLAWQLAKRLNVPLVVNFQDLFCLSQFVPEQMRPFPWLVPWLVERYRMLNREADHAFYTSEGMRDWFGLEGKGDVLYPIGDFGVLQIKDSVLMPDYPLKVVYAGNCYGAYGRMLLRLAQAVRHRKDIQFKIFAAGNDWPEDQIQQMTAAGIYQGFKPFKQLKQDFQQTDAFLTVMSFEEAESPFMETSFTTKWLDYVPYGKPVFAWAPEYSTACQFARQYQAGIAVAEDDPDTLVATILAAVANPDCWAAATQGARHAAETALNAERIHTLFVDRVTRVCRRSQHQRLAPLLQELP